MTEKRFTWEYSHHDSTGEIIDWIRNECLMTDYLQKYELEEWCQELNKIVDENNQLRKENGQLKKYNKSQELEIIRLHNLADAMSAVLRELGIYDVYNDEQIENVKRMIVND